MNALGRVREKTEKKMKVAIHGCSNEGRGGVHPVGACYTLSGSPGSEQKQLDQTSMNEGGSEARWKASTAGNRVSRNLSTVDRGWTETEGVHHGRPTELRKQGRKRRKCKRPLIRPEWGEMRGLRRQQRRTEQECGIWWLRHGSCHMKGLQEATSYHPPRLKTPQGSADMN